MSPTNEILERFRWPRRRAYLPGRGRLREIIAHPARTVRARLPSRRATAGRLADDQRLIGLLMIRDEDDVLDEMLRAATRWFDRILVLDGTTDAAARERTDTILDAHPEVIHRRRDDELGHIVRDGARQYLLDEARRRFGVDNWVGLLHADEFLDQDPRPMLAARHAVRAGSLRVRLVHTFLHVDDAADWATREARPLRSRVTHLMWPGVPEARFFFDTGERDYDVMHHGKVVPTSYRNGPLVDGYVITQYNERTPAQVQERARQRATDDWQLAHYSRFAVDGGAVFTRSLDQPDAPFAPEFDGDPEGPFVVRDSSSVPWGPIPTAPTPRLVIGGEPEPLRPAVDLPYLIAPGGLLDLLDGRPSRSGVRKWGRRMRGAWRGAAAGRDPVAGYEALLRHTETVLASSRTTEAHRRRVAAELLRRLHDRAALDTGWYSSVPAGRADSLRALVSTGLLELEEHDERE